MAQSRQTTFTFTEYSKTCIAQPHSNFFVQHRFQDCRRHRGRRDPKGIGRERSIDVVSDVRRRQPTSSGLFRG